MTIDGSKTAFRQHRVPGIWLDQVKDQGKATANQEALSAEQMLSEALPFGLRLTEGLPLKHYKQLAGTPLAEDRLETLAQEGLVHISDGVLKVTDEGRPVIDALARYLQS